MREIKLSKGMTAKVSDEDFDFLSQFKWCASAHGRMKKFYAIRNTPSAERKEGKARKIWMHRVIMNCPDTHVVDHIDGDGLNNQRDNLRIVTYSENARYAVHKTNSRPKGKKTSEEPWI